MLEEDYSGSGVFLSPLEIVTASPAIRMTRSTPVPIPTASGIERVPVIRDASPVAASRRMNGKGETTNAFTTTISRFSPFHGLFFEEDACAASEMTAKAAAMNSLQPVSTAAGGALGRSAGSKSSISKRAAKHDSAARLTSPLSFL